jgi:hypothetical protein
LLPFLEPTEAGFETFSEPTWEQCTAEGCWDFAEQWMFFVAYVMLAGTFALIEVSRRIGWDECLLEEIDDGTTHAFNDWFADADKIVESHTPDEVHHSYDPTKSTHKHKSSADPNFLVDEEETYQKPAKIVDDTEGLDHSDDIEGESAGEIEA